MRNFKHIHLNIEGGIIHAKELRGCITVDGKTLNTVKEVREFLRGQQALGRRVLPYGECDNFDYQTGCKGHTVPDENPHELEGKEQTHEPYHKSDTKSKL